MRGLILAVLLALAASAGAQEQDRAAALDRAYDEVVAAQAALQRVEEASQSGVEPLPGERLGTVSPSGERRSRLSDEYWERQRWLEKDLEQARARLDEALARWNALR
jgi:hypothetical protein